MVENKKLSFLDKIKISIFDFDGYQILAAEKISRTIGYIVLLIIIFSIVITLSYVYQMTEMINKTKNYIETEIAEITYDNYELSIKTNNEENYSEIDVDDLLTAKIIINTQTTDEEQIQKSIDEISSQENGILILKDRIIIKNEFATNLSEYSYKDISEEYNINKIDKTEIINMLSGQNLTKFLLVFATVMFIYLFTLYLSSLLIDIFLLAILAYIVTRIAGLRLRLTAVYNIASYSLTLPVIMNIIYFVINRFTGFTIEYFQIMYTAVASIYIITAVLMIKSDVIRKQYELSKIVEEQERVKAELQKKEEEKKEQEEQERREREKEKQKEKEKKEQKKKEENKGGEEPEGNNA